MSKFCGKCGAMVNENKKFCPTCGNKLNAVSTETIPNNDMSDYISFNAYNTNNDILNKENLTSQRDYNLNQSTQRSTMSCVLSVVLSLLFFVFSFSATFIGALRVYLSEDNFEDVISDIDLTDININYDGEQVSIANFLFYNMKDEFINKYAITTEKIENIFNDSTVNNQLENYLVDYVQYIVNGEKSKKLTTDGVIDIIKKIAPQISMETGYQFKDKDYEDIRNEINDGYMKFLVASNIEDSIGFDPTIIQIPFSTISLVILIILSIASLILILKCNGWKFKYLFKYAGVTIITIGTLLTCVALSGWIISITTKIYLLSALLSPLSLKLLIFGLGALIIGIVLFVLYRLKLKRERI